jgi:hypothetical protein
VRGSETISDVRATQIVRRHSEADGITDTTHTPR